MMSKLPGIKLKGFINAATVATVTLTILFAGCGEKIEETETNNLATLYAEILMKDALQKKGEGETQIKVDSLLKLGGYKTSSDFQERIEKLAREDPDGLKAVLDSTQKRLEEIRNEPEVTQNNE